MALVYHKLTLMLISAYSAKINVNVNAAFVQNVHIDVNWAMWYHVSIERRERMPCTEAQKKGNAAYNRRQDNIMIRPSKAEGARIRAAAAAAGLSVQRYILDTLRPHLPPDDADQADT